jgi:4-hydroxybenzoyl-CoA reductase subunit beta
MKLKPFTYYRPTTVQEVLQIVSALQPDEYIFMGGGTDVLVRMRQKQLRPHVVISLKLIQDMKEIKMEDDYLSVGAAATLDKAGYLSMFSGQVVALALACKQIGTLQIRYMGTIGGNICLETRCSYYNQIAWPGGFKPCYKRGGTLCHLVKRGTHCHALFCADTPPALMVLQATLCLVSSKGSREISINDFYRNDGMNHLSKNPDEIITRIKIPLRKRMKSAYARISDRQAVDFPAPGVAVSVVLNDERIAQEVYIAATGLLSRPVRLKNIEEMLKDTDLRRDLSQEFERGLKEVEIFPHHGVPPWYRRRMLNVLVTRAIGDILAEGRE